MFLQLVLLALIGVALSLPHPDPPASINPDHPIVNAPIGQIKGSMMKSRLGKPIYAFRGLRYAEAPINDLRFQNPVGIEKYDNGIYNATVDGPLCPQQTTEPTSEDCLFLNVYTTKLPKSNDDPKRPVLVYLHAGDFSSLSGSSSWAGPQYLLDQPIVLVTMNFRLGPFGFLSTGDKEAIGNYALKDQGQALKWVNANIEAFGGDPDQVTLMGHGSGAASVTLQMVSPMYHGLFQRSIALSGSGFAHIQSPQQQLDLAKKLAKLLSCPDDTSANIVKCLKTKRVGEIVDTLPKFKEFGNDPSIIWQPGMEGEHGQRKFLSGHPLVIIQKNERVSKIPFLTGITNDELANRAFNVVANETLRKEMNDNFEKFAPIAFNYERDTDHSKVISKALREAYLNTKPIGKETVSGLSQLYSDALIGFPVYRAAKTFSERSNQSVYYYKFSYKGRYSSFYTPESNGTIPFGVSHHDDLQYLFYIEKMFPEIKNQTAPEAEIINKMTTMIGNFVKLGNPTPLPLSDKLDNVRWEPFTVKNKKYLDIGNKLVLKENLFETRYSEWEKLFPISDYTKHKTASG